MGQRPPARLRAVDQIDYYVPRDLVVEAKRPLDSFRPQFAGEPSQVVRTFSIRGIAAGPGEGAECSAVEAAHVLDRRHIVGLNIRRARRLRGWSQARLADELNILPSRVSDYESGAYEPREPRLNEIARLLRIEDPIWFFADHPELDTHEDAES